MSTTGHLNTTLLPRQDSLKADLVFNKDEHRFSRLYWDNKASAVVFELVNRAKSSHRDVSVQIPPQEDNVYFSITYGADLIDFEFGASEMQGWKLMACMDVVDVSGSDFVGPVIGVFATCGQKVDYNVVFQNLLVDI